MKGLLNVEGANYRNIEHFRHLTAGIAELNKSGSAILYYSCKFFFVFVLVYLFILVLFR